MPKAKHVILAICIFLALFGLRYAIHLNARHHLLCEVLEPGMSKDEVLSVLNQAGEFWMRDSDSPSPNMDLHISFTDFKGNVLYGAFDLLFIDYKYVQAYIIGFERESGTLICDFYQPKQPITATPPP